jgi:SagB-type dehydrogenase family enzyme
VTSDAIARLLWAAQGQTASWGGRTAPSAGALYPLELYVATEDRLLRYLPAESATEDVTTEDRRLPIATATGGQAAASHAPIVFVLTGVLTRTAEKYGDRAERYVQLEAGHACQNLLLQATALGLGAVPIGAFDDDLLRSAIDADAGELPLYVVPVGHPTPG